jgi:feruloyl esterase
MRRLSHLLLFTQLAKRSYAWLDISEVTSLDLSARSPERRCIAFPTCLLDPHAFVNKVTYRPAQTLFDVPQAWVNTTTLPGFCQLELSITTNPETGRSVGAELWLPDEWDWNGRLLATGKHAFRGESGCGKA